VARTRRQSRQPSEFPGGVAASPIPFRGNRGLPTSVARSLSRAKQEATPERSGLTGTLTVCGFEGAARS
jgi:hypothetical protein